MSDLATLGYVARPQTHEGVQEAIECVLVVEMCPSLGELAVPYVHDPNRAPGVRATFRRGGHAKQLDSVIIRAKSVVELTSDGGSLEDLLKSGNEGGETTMCPCQGILAWIVKDAVFGVEASKAVDITLTGQLNVPPSQQFVPVHACQPFHSPIDSVVPRLPRPA